MADDDYVNMTSVDLTQDGIQLSGGYYSKQ